MTEPKFWFGFEVPSAKIVVGRVIFFVLIAFGVATRWLVPLATVIYSWLYFGSQLDSYQHHYLIAMLLVIACFVPWQPARGPVRAWALRLMLVELAIVYLWAEISKI